MGDFLSSRFNSALIIAGAVMTLTDYYTGFIIGLLLIVSGIILQFLPAIKKLFNKMNGN